MRRVKEKIQFCEVKLWTVAVYDNVLTVCQDLITTSQRGGVGHTELQDVMY